MTDTIITQEIAAKVLAVVDAGLVSGLGKPILGQMCVEAAVCYALGLPHGDEPSCVSPVLRAFKIRLNDANWLSTKARTKGLRRLALIQLGSAGYLNELEFVQKLSILTIKTVVPIALRNAAKLNPKFKNELLRHATNCEQEGTRAAAYAARAAADAAARAADAAAYDARAAAYDARAAAYAARAAADAAARAADAAADAAAYDARAATYAAADAAADARAATYAADAADAAARAADDAATYAAYAAYAAADADAAYAAADAADAAARAADDAAVLAEFSEHVVQLLIEMNVPGTQWLTLAPLEGAA